MDLTALIGVLWDLREQHGNVPVWLLDATNGRLGIESVEFNRSQGGVYVAAPQAPDVPPPRPVFAGPSRARNVRAMIERMRYDAGTQG